MTGVFQSNVQQTLNSTLADAYASGCDTTQFKYDGMSVQYCISDGTLQTLNGSGLAVADSIVGFDPSINCTLIGTYIPTTHKRWVFDCWCIQESDHVVDLRDEPYRSRYVAAKIECKLLGDVVSLVTNHAILKAPALWAMLPHAGDVKGLVFRDSKASARGTVRVARWYKEAPKELE